MEGLLEGMVEEIAEGIVELVKLFLFLLTTFNFLDVPRV